MHAPVCRQSYRGPACSPAKAIASFEIEGVRASAIWPPKFTASPAPVVVYDAEGAEFAREGEILTAVMLGPKKLDHVDGCGLTNVIEVYFRATTASGAPVRNGLRTNEREPGSNRAETALWGSVHEGFIVEVRL